MNLINRLINKKNDDYYTVSKDTGILNDESSVNDKQAKVHDGFTKFMLVITLLLLLACIIFCPIAIIAYYKTHMMWPIIGLKLGLGLVLFLIVSFTYRKLTANNNN